MWVFLIILSIPLIEIGLFVQIGGAIGLWATIAWVIGAAALGIIVLKGVAGLGAVSLSRDMHELSDPLSPLAHKVMLVIGAVLLIVPGFLTDFFGLMLLIPPVRLLIIRLIARRLKRRFATPDRVTTIDGEWTNADPDVVVKPGDAPSKWTRH